MLSSRALSSAERKSVQSRFSEYIGALNRSKRYRSALVSKFAITLGDEFQGILKDSSVLPDLIWDVTGALGLPAFRLGIGYGTIDTAIPPYAINLDGPALHRARAAIETAKSGEILGGVFVGFGEEIDEVANGIARLLSFHVHKRSSIQLRVLGFLRQGYSQVEIARLMNQSPQAVSQHKKAAGWESFHAGEQALCAILRIATAPRPK
jgi:hypothetical protein